MASIAQSLSGLVIVPSQIFLSFWVFLFEVKRRRENIPSNALSGLLFEYKGHGQSVFPLLVTTGKRLRILFLVCDKLEKL